MWGYWVMALGICIAAAAIEGLCAGREPMAKLGALRQPIWSPPAWLWVLIGVAWYGICFTGMVRLLPLWAGHKLPVTLLVALMLANALVNVPTFRMMRLDLAFYPFAPYWLLLAAFLSAVWPLDPLTFTLFALYGGYQIYAACWGYRLWRMNRSDVA
jgi:tryptophan-rich sensory protein